VAKQVIFTEQARADLRKIEQNTALQILKTLTRFLQSEEGNVKRIEGVEPPLFRLRAQDYRVFFREVDDAVQILRVRNRRDAYR
jgi:mRNA-degrading endonuclease RelE of RelBE toxin-antitoxin system